MKRIKTKQICLIVFALLFIIAIPLGVYEYKYSQYKNNFNKAMSQLGKEKYDESLNTFNDISNTYFGKKNSDKIKKEIEKAKKFKENKKVYDEALKLLNDKKYLDAINSFKKISMDDTKRYGMAKNKINECKSSYIAINVQNAKNNAKINYYGTAINYLNLVLELDAANKDAITLKDEYTKVKEAVKLKAKQEGFECDIQDDSIKIIKCLNYGTDITIPEQVEGIAFKLIGEEAFYQHTDMISVSIPQNIIYIGNAAFYRCYSLKKITIPKNVEQIVNNPVFRCSSLTQIFVDPENNNFSELDGVLYTKDKSVLLAYPEGKTNESYTIPSSVKKIDGSAFGYHCKKLKTIIIPSSVIDFPDYNIFVFPDQVTLKVKSGSAAEHYCKSNDLKYEIY